MHFVPNDSVKVQDTISTNMVESLVFRSRDTRVQTLSFTERSQQDRCQEFDLFVYFENRNKREVVRVLVFNRDARFWKSDHDNNSINCHICFYLLYQPYDEFPRASYKMVDDQSKTMKPYFVSTGTCEDICERHGLAAATKKSACKITLIFTCEWFDILLPSKQLITAVDKTNTS